MTETKYSEFTLNFNPRFRRKGDDGTDDKSKSDRKPPTLVGKAKVIDSDGTETEFEVAAWGPNAAKTGGPDYYSGTLNPKDPAWRARQMSATIDGPVRNAIEGFELKQLGSLRLFERTGSRNSGSQGQRQITAALLRPWPRASALGSTLYRSLGLVSPGARLLLRQRAAARSGRRACCTRR